MEILLLGIYSFFVWLVFFKFKWLAWTMTAAVIVITIPIIGLATLILLLNVVAPSALDVQVVKYVVQVLPRVTGRVIEVPVEPNRLVRRGELLFRIDPRPFQYEVERRRVDDGGRGSAASGSPRGRGADRRVRKSCDVDREFH